MAKTKIVVIQLKEIIYTVIFAALGILLILLLIYMFTDKDDEVAPTSTKLYTAGKYNTSITLQDTSIDLEVVVDENHINSINIKNIDETITTMYPLMKPSLEAISVQLCNDVPIDEVELEENSKFTQTLLLDGIRVALEKAKVKQIP